MEQALREMLAKWLFFLYLSYSINILLLALNLSAN